MIYSIFVLLLLSAVSIDAFSATLQRQTGNNKNRLPSSLLEGLRRATLKRQLVEAAKAKDEDRVVTLVNELSTINPTAIPTQGLLGYAGTNNNAPLAGPWTLLYTNARDAEAPARTSTAKDAPFGKAVASGVTITTGQRIDAAQGECVNSIVARGDQRPFDRLDITIRMTPLSDTRVRLDFVSGRARNAKAPLPFLQDVRFPFPPAFVGDAVAVLKGKDPKVEPPAFFDVLYIDGDIRAHRTGEGKIFVQKRGDSFN